MEITWLGHASFKLSFDHKVIYIDPYAGEDYTDKADIILVSHGHHDHCSIKKIDMIRVDDTVVLTTQDNRYNVNGQAIASGETIDIDGISIKAIPAYNINKQFHEKEHGGIGFIITADNISIYFAGDTDLIPEMDNLRPTVALLPVGGTYTMNAKEAAKAAERINPKLVIPMHYGYGIAGTQDDAILFKELVEVHPDIKVKIMKKEESIDIDSML